MEWGTNKVGSLQNELEAANKEKQALEANIASAGEEAARLRGEAARLCGELKAAQDALQKRQKEVGLI
jgi:predicted  nucleic acid-binding Zn-ribbon protein